MIYLISDLFPSLVTPSSALWGIRAVTPVTFSARIYSSLLFFFTNSFFLATDVPKSGMSKPGLSRSFLPYSLAPSTNFYNGNSGADIFPVLFPSNRGFAHRTPFPTVKFSSRQSSGFHLRHLPPSLAVHCSRCSEARLVSASITKVQLFRLRDGPFFFVPFGLTFELTLGFCPASYLH